MNKGNYTKYINQKFNRLTIVSILDNGRQYAICKCDCGNEVKLLPNQVISGLIKSCGCLRKETCAKSHTIHNGSHHPLYQCYRDMINRCSPDKSNPNYKYYYSKGIDVCEEWKSNPNNFYKWVESIGGKPPHTTLDRIDNSKGYNPDNCRFVTMHEQSRNKNSNIFITYNNKTQCVEDWSIETGISDETIRRRFHQGLPLEWVFYKGHLPRKQVNQYLKK